MKKKINLLATSVLIIAVVLLVRAIIIAAWGRSISEYTPLPDPAQAHALCVQDQKMTKFTLPFVYYGAETFEPAPEWSKVVRISPKNGKEFTNYYAKDGKLLFTVLVTKSTEQNLDCYQLLIQTLPLL